MRWWVPVAVSLVPFVGMVGAHVWAVCPGGDWSSLMLAWMVLPLLALPAALAVPVLLVLLLWRKLRPDALWGLALCVGYGLGFAGGIEVGQRVRMAAFNALGERSAPLIAAIKAYEHDRGRAPARLQELVPKYLPAVPTTGIGAYPEFRYEADYDTPGTYYANDWALSVDTPSGGINFDQFIYLPRGDYSTVGSDDEIVRLGDWAYYNE